MHQTRLRLFWLVGACTILLSGYQTAFAFIYGIPASAIQFPFVVGIYYWPPILNGKSTQKTIPFCTGTITTLDWVITTYGCINGKGIHPHRVEQEVKPENIRIVAGSAYAPANTTTWPKYAVRTCSQIRFPQAEDFMEIFSLDEEKARERASNAYTEKDAKGNAFYRYYLDYAVLKTDEPWQINTFVQTAPFPVGYRNVIDLWWSNKVNETRYGYGYMQRCYAIGWGGWDESLRTQLRMRYTPVKFVPYENCEAAFCTECSYCNKSIRINPKTEACYKSLMYGDGCRGDEGAPVWCPWYGEAKTRTGRVVRVGSVLGFLSYRASCYDKNLPSVYHHSWNIYSMMTRARGGAQWPPDLWVYGETRG